MPLKSPEEDFDNLFKPFFIALLAGNYSIVTRI